MSATATASKGVSLKTTALAKLYQSVHLLDAAREALANLEGDGYCDTYEALANVRGNLSSLTSKLDRLKPPTGVFEI